MKQVIVALSLSVLILSHAAAQIVDGSVSKFNQFDESLSDFLGEINSATPDSAVIGGVWSDAYIGQLLGVPPHFGVGLAAGASRFPIAALADAVQLTGGDLPSDTLFLPNFAAECRIGGFILPFDFGVRVGGAPAKLSTLLSDNISVNYFNLGVDLRYAIIEENLVLPNVSAGIGYYYVSGSAEYEFSETELQAVNVVNASNQNNALDITFSTGVVEAKAQISKSFVIVTPYAGLAAYRSVSEASYSLADIHDSSTDTRFAARIFGGASLNFLALKFDIGGTYNFMSTNWGINIGTRIQF